MKFSKTILVLLIAISVCFCANNNRSEAIEKLIRANEINGQHIEQSRFSVFIMRFSNIIFEEKGKKIQIPIFQGKYGDVKNDDIIKYCIENKFIDEKIWLRYIVKCKNGEVKKNLHEFLAFYKSNILKDVNLKDSKAINLSSGQWRITYDFVIDGVPCYLEISFLEKEEDQTTNPVYKSVYDINPEENLKDPSFTYLFIVGSKSTD